MPHPGPDLAVAVPTLEPDDHLVARLAAAAGRSAQTIAAGSPVAGSTGWKIAAAAASVAVVTTGGAYAAGVIGDSGEPTPTPVISQSPSENLAPDPAPVLDGVVAPTDPASLPSAQPAGQPAGQPSGPPPSAGPTAAPSASPPAPPSGVPTGQPSGLPTGGPGSHPTGRPSWAASPSPTHRPIDPGSGGPTDAPTHTPPTDAPRGR
jgi:hypothetical protein